MKVLVTGGSGYVGAHIVRELILFGHEVTVVTREAVHCQRRPEGTSVRLIQGDLKNQEVLQTATSGQDALIHNAILWDDEPTELALQDPICSARLFEVAVAAGISDLIYTSSTAVHRPFKLLMSEDTPIHPADSYGAVKACSEMLLSAIASTAKVRWNVVRLGPVVGAPAFASGPFKSDRRIVQFVESAVRNEDLVVKRYSGRQFIGARDAARTFRTLLESNVSGQTFLCLSENQSHWQDIAAEIVERIGSQSSIIVEPEEPLERCHFDVGKLESVLGLRFDAKEAVTEHLRVVVQKARP